MRLTTWRVLGPVEVVSGGRVLDVRRPQQRGVLALLLLNADHVVTAGQIGAALWAGAAPESARTQVQVCVSKIRAALRAGGLAGTLTSRAGGYRLAPGAGELDLAVFGELVRSAREDAGAGRPAPAADALRAALALWRGPALAGASGAFVEAAAAALGEQRLTACEELAEAELALGRYDSVVRALTPLAQAHPLRERLVARLVLALAGCGRQSQALRLFAQTRSLLAEELGLEPGAELVMAQLRVLRQQVAAPAARPVAQVVAPVAVPTVVAPTTVTPTVVAPTVVAPTVVAPTVVAPVAVRAVPPVVPAQLPADIPGFTGRAAPLSELDALLAQDGAGGPATTVVISAIGGTAGVGKTALAVHWAHRVAHRFPDGQLYADLRGFDLDGRAVPASEALRGFLGALGVPPQRVPAEQAHQAGLYRSLLAGRRMLIVLDNARDPGQVRPLLPGAPGSLVLVTSRNRLDGLVIAEAARPLTLDLLSAAESRDLLASRAGRRRIGAEPGAVQRIVTRCAGLPLALAIAGARAASNPALPLGALADDLDGSRGSLAAFGAGDPATDVRAVFSCSYRTLDAAAARLFRLLGLHPGPDAAPAAVASLAGMAPAALRPLLACLVGAHLLTERTPGRYGLHDLLRAYAAELSRATDSAAERDAARRRLFDHYLHTAHAADLLIDPYRLAQPITLPDAPPGVAVAGFRDHDAAMRWFTAEREILLAVIGHAAATGCHGHSWRLAGALTTFLDRQGHWPDLARVQRLAMGAARQQGDLLGQALAHRGLAIVATWRGRHAEARAHYQHGLDLYRAMGDDAGRAATHIGISWLLARQERYRPALDHSQQALSLYQAIGSNTGQAKALNNIGWLHARVGSHRQALDCCEQALAIHQLAGDRHGEALAWDNIGYARHCLGQHERAAGCYHRALALHRDLGDRYDEADVLVNLGDTLDAAGDPAAARLTWRQALTIYDDLRHPDADELRARLFTTEGPAHLIQPQTR